MRSVAQRRDAHSPGFYAGSPPPLAVSAFEVSFASGVASRAQSDRETPHEGRGPKKGGGGGGAIPPEEEACI